MKNKVWNMSEEDFREWIKTPKKVLEEEKYSDYEKYLIKICGKDLKGNIVDC